MLSRLVLGCGSVGHALVEAVRARPGDLRVLDPDASRVEALRNERVPAEQADVTDGSVVGAEPADLVVVAGDDPATNAAAAGVAASVHPDALLLAYTGPDATAAQRRRVREVADRVVDDGTAVVTELAAVMADPERERARRLRETLAAVDGPLGVFTHDNPDPDAIAAAVALAAIAEVSGTAAEACYTGEIAHQENRALVNLLDLDLRRISADEVGAALEEFGGVALVDHARPGVNDQLPPDTPVDVVIDHHPRDEAVTATFVDVRDEVGATSTLLANYVEHFPVEVADTVATALLYGIRVDTKDFSRDISKTDFEAAARLLPDVDAEVMEAVENPSVSQDTFETIAEAIRNRRVEGSALGTCVGAIADRDALAQAADRLLAMEGVTTTLACGFTEGVIYVSARSRQSDVPLGEVLRDAFGDIGSAGGHVDMAGAQIPMGPFGALESEAETDLQTVVADAVLDRFFDALRERGGLVPGSGGEGDDA